MLSMHILMQLLKSPYLNMLVCWSLIFSSTIDIICWYLMNPAAMVSFILRSLS